MKKLKQLLSLALACCLLVGIFPTTALAAISTQLAEGNGGNGEPELLELTVEDKNGNVVSLLENEPIVSMGESYTFAVTFSNPSKIKKVYITSTKESGTKYLEAIWDGSAFKTQGLFDDNANYVPGKIGVEYTKNVEFIDLNTGVDLSAAEEKLKNMTSVTITKPSGENAEHVVTTVDLSKLLGAETGVAVEATFDVLDAAAGTTMLNDWLGAYQNLEDLTSYAINSSEYYLYLDYSDTTTYAMILRDVSGNKYYKLICKEIDENFDSFPSLVSSLEATNTVSSLTYDFLSISNSTDELRQQVAERDGISDELRSKLYDDIDAYEKDRQLFSLAMTVIPAVTAATGGTMTAPTILFGALLSALNAAADMFWDYRVGMITEYDKPLDTEFVCATPLTRKLLANGELTDGGSYCLVNSSPGSFTMNNISVDLCLHGHSCSVTNNGGSLTIRDCNYYEAESVDPDNVWMNHLGSVKSDGGVVEFDHCRGSITMKNNGTTSVYGGQLDLINNEDSEAYVYNSHITGSAKNKNGSLTLENVTAQGIVNTTGTMEITNSIIGRGVGSVGVTNDENGTVTVTDSTVFGYESTEKNGNWDCPAIKNISGKITIIGGEIVSSGRSNADGAAIHNSGIAEVLSGKISGSCSEGDGTCVYNKGKFTVQSGTFVGGLVNSYDGELIINDGTFQSIGSSNLRNETANGTMTVNNGIFRTSAESNVVTKTGNVNYLPETTINGGIFYADSGNCIRNEALRVSSRVISPKTTVFDGTFFSENKDSVYNSGEMKIHGGFFYANYDDSSLSFDSGCVRNGERFNNYGLLSIDGGTFLNEGSDYCVCTPNENGLSITNGQFLSSSDGIHGGTCNVVINADSDILVYANYRASVSFYKSFNTGAMLYETPVSLKVAADIGYSGNIKHYTDIASTDGTTISFAQANNLDISAPYLRLTSAEISGSADIVEIPDLIPKQDITFTTPTSLNKIYGDTSFVNVALNNSTDGGKIIYKSSNTSVATVDNSSGEVTIVGAGTTKISATALAVENKYAETTISYTLTVMPKAIVPIVDSIDPVDYTGNQIKPAVIIRDKDVLLKSTDYEVEYGANVNAGVGSINIKAKPNGNYSFDDIVVSFAIRKTIYTGKTSAMWETKYGTSRTVDLRPLLAEGYELGMLSVLTDSNNVLDGVPTMSGTMLTFAFVDDESITGKTATIKIPVINTTNYIPYDITVTVTAIDKLVQIELKFAESTKSVAYGETLTFSAAGAVAGSKVTYESSDPTVATVDEAGKIFALKVGTATITATASATADYAQTSVSYILQVDRATVTVKATDRSIYVGGTVPNLATPAKDTDYTITGLIGEDALTGAVEMKYQLDGEDVAPDSTKTGSYDIVISGVSEPSGGNYNTIVLANGKLTIGTRPPVPSGGSGSSSSDSSSSSSDSSSSSTSVTTSTNTESGTSTTETIAILIANTSGGKATTTIDTNVGNEIVRQAVANKSENVVIAPKVTGNVTKAEVSIPTAIVDKISTQTSASLTVSTPVADVTIPNGGLRSLSSADSQVTVTTEQTGTGMEMSVKVGGKTVESIPGGLIVTVPVAATTPGTVAVLMHEDGTREVVRKSVAGKDVVMIPLDGSAKLEIVDNSRQFSDVTASNWEADAVAFVSAHELFNGTGAGKFSPNLPMSRGMLAVVLHNLESNPDQTVTDVFADVDSRDWYAEGIAWAAANGIVGGYGNGQFGPNDNITRQQLAVMLWRYAGSPATISQEMNFDDVGNASSYALDALCWAVYNGIINGYGNGQLDPKGLATRAQVAQMLKNYLEK